MQTHAPTHTASLLCYGTRKESGQHWGLSRLLAFIAMVYKLVFFSICWAPLAEPGQFPGLRGQKPSHRLQRVLEISFPSTILSHCLVVQVFSGLLYVTRFYPDCHAWAHSAITLVPAFSPEINKRLVLLVNHKSTKKSKHWTDVQYLKGLYTDFPCKQSDSTITDYKTRSVLRNL